MAKRGEPARALKLTGGSRRRRRSSRMRKSVENDRVQKFIQIADETRDENHRNQIWFEYEEFKDVVYLDSSARLTAGRELFLEKEADKRSLRIVYSRDETMIGFVLHDEEVDMEISEAALSAFIEIAGNRGKDLGW